MSIQKGELGRCKTCEYYRSAGDGFSFGACRKGIAESPHAAKFILVCHSLADNNRTIRVYLS